MLSTITSNGPIFLLVKVRRLLCLNRILKNVDYCTIVLTNSSTRQRERERRDKIASDGQVFFLSFSFGDKTSDKTRSSLKSSEPLAWLS